MKKDSTIKNALILFAITLIAGLLLGLTYNITSEPRAYQDRLKTENALSAVIENAKFTEEEILGEPKFITKIYKGTTDIDGQGDLIGYAFQLETTEGYGDLIKLMVGLSADGTVSGIDIIKHSETPGLGAKAKEPGFKDQFAGKQIAPLELVKGNSDNQNIDAIGGATITSRAVMNAVNEAIEYYMINIAKEEK